MSPPGRGRTFTLGRARMTASPARIKAVGLVTALMGGLVGAWLGFLVYAAVAVMWLIPDRRIEEKVVEEIEQEEQSERG